MDTAIPSWTNYFMGIAQAVSARSKDPSTKVGAVIVNSQSHIVATGFNGMPRGFPETEAIWQRPMKYDYVIHAEANCIAHATSPLAECVLYTTMFPCGECAKLIAAAGIKTVHYSDGKYSNDVTRHIFDMTGINLVWSPL